MQRRKEFVDPCGLIKSFWILMNWKKKRMTRRNASRDHFNQIKKIKTNGKVYRDRSFSSRLTSMFYHWKVFLVHSAHFSTFSLIEEAKDRKIFATFQVLLMQWFSTEVFHHLDSDEQQIAVISVDQHFSMDFVEFLLKKKSNKRFLSSWKNWRSKVFVFGWSGFGFWSSVGFRFFFIA